nr:ATP-binding protein [Micromonospora sp. DSM 115978]
RFSRAASGNAATKPGTGLGLFIVRELVRANGGDVSYRSVRPHGSTFTVTVPAAQCPPADRVQLTKN